MKRKSLVVEEFRVIKFYKVRFYQNKGKQYLCNHAYFEHMLWRYLKISYLKISYLTRKNNISFWFEMKKFDSRDYDICDNCFNVMHSFFLVIEELDTAIWYGVFRFYFECLKVFIKSHVLCSCLKHWKRTKEIKLLCGVREIGEVS